ncbi:flagellar motor protein MotB [uncultured Nisaea sp.]|uniref:flagellar motor protein MotB n=1 Tax=uncultured Nisaea sp. TaxID=538215 RepID=UPI0030EF731E
MDNHATIIIKKVKKGGHGGHHGGAWKVAYADFVTAMMAFFLLLWLLNATTEEQKMGISNYFDPTAISRSTRSGSGGVLGGTSITVPGALKSASSPPMISTPQVARPQAENTESLDADSDDPENIESRLGSDDDAEGLISAEKLEKLLEEREAAQFASAEKMLRKAIEDSNDPELKEIADSLQIDHSPEGLRIQLLDQEKVALFPLGSADMFEQTRKLLAKVSEIISKLPNKIKISGHTDSRPFPEGATYTNWELSADRALSSRRALIANGIPDGRVAQVVGMADTDPIEPNDPTSPSNRRISIVLLKQDFSDQAADAVASGQPAVQPLETTLPPPITIAPDTGSALPPIRSGG